MVRRGSGVRSRVDDGRFPPCTMPSDARQVHERAVRGTGGRVREARDRAPFVRGRRLRDAADRRDRRGRDEPLHRRGHPSRVGALQEPMTVMRGAAYGNATDAPYQPLVRALCGRARRRCRTTTWPRSSARRPRRSSGSCPSLASRVGGTRAEPAAGSHDRAGAPSAAPAGGRPRCRSVGSGSGGRSCSSSRTCTALTPGRATLVTFLARIAAIAAAGDRRRRTRLTRSGVTTLGRSTWPALDAAPRPPRALTLPPLDARRPRPADRGDRGERPSASVLVVVVERSGGRPLVAEELLAARRELPGVSLTSSFEDLVLARIGGALARGRRVLRLLAPAGRPLSRATARGHRRGVRGRADGGPPRSSSAPRHGDGVLDADLAAGLDEALEHGFARRGRRRRRVLRHELVGRAIEADLLPSARVRHHAAVAAALADQPFVGDAPPPASPSTPSLPAWRRSPQPMRPRPWMRRPTSWRALELAIAARARAPAGRRRGPRQRPVAAGAIAPVLSDRPTSASARPRRRSPPGAPVRAAAYLDATIGAPDAPPRPDAARVCIYDRLGQFRRVAGDAEGALAARRRAVELVPTTPSSARATVVAGLAQLLMLEGTFSEAEKLARDAIRVARACDPPARGAGSCTRRRRSGCRSAGGPTRKRRSRCSDEARAMAEELGDLDELFRVYANLTTVLDLAGRHEEAVAVAGRGHRGGAGRPVSRRSTATSCAATPPIRCSCWAAGRRRAR